MKLPVASHTFLNDWDNCPHKAFRKYIKKDLPRQPQTEAMAWGNTVHSAFEVRIKHGTAFPKEMEKYEAIAAPLVAVGAAAEKMLGITVDGRLCDFFAPDVWLRGKIDATVVRGMGPIAAIFDWKTGKRREEKAELLTHAVLLKAWQPTVQKITAHYVWLQDNEVGKAHDVSDTETKLAEIRSVMNTVQNCMEIEDFPKRPNPLCGWCDVLDCEFNRKGRT
jgi:PD-(D/E)XK nuclease superfamily